MEKFFEMVEQRLCKIESYALMGAKNTLTMKECADYLGLSKSHLYRLCMQRAIPHYKGAGGKFTYFDKQELDGWAKSRRVATTAENESQAAAYLVTSKQSKK
jgi:excisionase family DNA binding protein